MTTTTIATFVGNGSQTDFAFSFDYLRKEFVKVLVDGIETAYTFHTTQTVRVTPAPAVGKVVVIKRATEANSLVEFVDGSILIANDLNVAALQSLHVAEEAVDLASGSLLIDETGAYTAGGRRISNVGTPTAADDVATKGWTETGLTSQVALAASSAAAAAASAASAASLVAEKNVKDVAALLADTALSYLNSSVGDVVRTRSEGFSYTVAASGVTDQHVTTAGGVKLYVRAGANGVSVDAFGAVGDGSADDAAVLLRVAAFAGTNQTVPIVFDKFYRSTSPLVFNSNSLRIVFSVPGQSGILFDNCNGITITQTLKYAGLSIEGGVIVTNVNQTRTGLTYTNSAAATGDMLPKAITGLTLIGLDRFRLIGPDRTHGWLAALSITNGDRFYLNDIYIQGAEQDRTDGFPAACKGIVASGSTHLIMNNPHVFSMETAVEVTGQSEGVEINRGTLVANKKGVNFAPDVAPANDTNIVGVHIASMDYNIRLAGSFSTVMHNVSGCLLFTRTESYVSSTFKHIIADGQLQISDNYFFTATTIDPTNHIGVDLIAPASGGVHSGSLVTANIFTRIPTLVNIASGVINAAVNGNVTKDDASSLTAAPVVDAGIGTTIGFNFGDRDFGEAKSSTGVFWSPAASPGLYNGVNKNLILSATQGVSVVENYVNILGGGAASGPTIRALGSDTLIDLVLQPKGGSAVRPASDIVSSLGKSGLRWSALYAKDIRPGAGSAVWTSGSGTPEGAVPAPVGSLFTRLDGGASTTLYVKESGASTATGWVAK